MILYNLIYRGPSLQLCLVFRDHPFQMSAFFRGVGVKILPNLPTDNSKECRRRGVGVKNRENLPTSELDGPLHG